eukprot:Plantae.Rhodophyta-Hildenbrandia_rubra.ctg9394.p2 GENE.Plantae.Rhodophyta-Hildenbrandia_rubra.ctg9394~~Plantae.Rhodophyta-Hildenbrandia_rubra.ctg9394.p2  ORF type:complete len:101 (-),score=4.35 Plantae.Rhodophyta-Hildenbrandia_rubra.ctg9394:414-716(-)
MFAYKIFSKIAEMDIAPYSTVSGNQIEVSVSQLLTEIYIEDGNSRPFCFYVTYYELPSSSSVAYVFAHEPQNRASHAYQKSAGPNDDRFKSYREGLREFL